MGHDEFRHEECLGQPNGGSSSTGITDSLDNSTVAGHELSDGQKTESD